MMDFRARVHRQSLPAYFMLLWVQSANGFAATTWIVAPLWI
jgi:hypothetical protein